MLQSDPYPVELHKRALSLIKLGYNVAAVLDNGMPSIAFDGHKVTDLAFWELPQVKSIAVELRHIVVVSIIDEKTSTHHPNMELMSGWDFEGLLLKTTKAPTCWQLADGKDPMSQSNGDYIGNSYDYFFSNKDANGQIIHPKSIYGIFVCDGKIVNINIRTGDNIYWNVAPSKTRKKYTLCNERPANNIGNMPSELADAIKQRNFVTARRDRSFVLLPASAEHYAIHDAQQQHHIALAEQAEMPEPAAVPNDDPIIAELIDQLNEDRSDSDFGELIAKIKIVITAHRATKKKKIAPAKQINGSSVEFMRDVVSGKVAGLIWIPLANDMAMKVKSSDLYLRYSDWCSARNESPKNPDPFWKEINEIQKSKKIWFGSNHGQQRGYEFIWSSVSERLKNNK